MQHRTGGKAVVADDARANAGNERPRGSFGLVASSAALDPVVESNNAAVEGIEYVAGRKRLRSLDDKFVEAHAFHTGFPASSLRSLRLFFRRGGKFPQ